MLQMRKSVFETNSSSTHSITMCTQDEYSSWVNGDVLFNDGWWSADNTSEFKNKKFVTREQAEDIIKKEKFYDGEDISKRSDDELSESYDDEDAEYHDEYPLYTFKSYLAHNEYLEYFEQDYTAPSGDVIVAFGSYGYD